MHVGILTGGGDAPGLNAVIRAVAKTAIIQYGWRVSGILDGFAGLLGEPRSVRLELGDVRGLLPRGGTILGTTNRSNPFKIPVEEKGRIRTVDRSDEVVANVQKLGLDALIVVGGDGSLRIAQELGEKGVRIVGIPKTIDNDLSATDVTFGFDTALNTAVEALDRLHTTAESHHRVMVLEVMGRYAGWIALHAGIAGGADVIMVPEIPFDFAAVIRKIKERLDRAIQFSVIVVAEGARPLGGEMIFQEEEAAGHERRLGGIGHFVAAEISNLLEVESRVTVLGHLQRGGNPSAFDRLLATRFGVAAVQLIASQQFGRMVCLHGRDISAVPLLEGVCQLRRVDPAGKLVAAAERLGICVGR